MLKALPASLIALGVLAAASAQNESPRPKAGARLPKAVVDAHELMEIFSEPLYEDLKKKMASQPKNDWGGSS